MFSCHSCLLFFQAGRLFDHGGTVFFSIFMSLWAVMFLEYWKRMNATLTYQWDCSEFEDIEVWPLSTYTPAAKTEHWPMVHFRLCLLQERPRPQFTAMAPMMTKNLITGKDEPYFPKRNRFNRIVAGSMVIIMMVRELLSWVEMWGLEQEQSDLGIKEHF